VHLSLDLYLLVLHGALPPEPWVREAHGHLLEVCPECREEWTTSRGGDRSTARPALAAPPPPIHPPDPLPADDEEISLADLDRRAEHHSTVLLNRRRAQEDLDRLLALPPAERVPRIETAQTRYRSRALAELLIDASRERARTDPAEAANLAALVPAVLHWMPDPGPADWPRALLARAKAHRANALREGGDLEGAAELFEELRREMAASPLDDAAARDEMVWLETMVSN